MTPSETLKTRASRLTGFLGLQRNTVGATSIGTVGNAYKRPLWLRKTAVPTPSFTGKKTSSQEYRKSPGARELNTDTHISGDAFRHSVSKDCQIKSKPIRHVPQLYLPTVDLLFSADQIPITILTASRTRKIQKIFAGLFDMSVRRGG